MHPDDETIEIQLAHPAPYFLELIASPLFSPLYRDSNGSVLTGEDGITNGPFYISKLEHDHSLMLKRNPLYWDRDRVQLEEIEIAIVPDANTALMLYEKGWADWVGFPFIDLSSEGTHRLLEEQKLERKPVDGVFWFSLNTLKVPFSSKKIRQAFSYALDRESIAKLVLDEEEPSRSVLPLSLRLLEEKELYPSNDPEIARKLFQEGLEELGISHKDFPAITLGHSEIVAQRKIAEFVQESWQRIFDIRINLEGAEWGVFFSNLRAQKYDIGGCIWFSVYNDPSYLLDIFREKSYLYNCSKWEHPHFQELLNLAEHESDSEIRNNYFKEAEHLLLSEMAIIPLYSSHFRFAKNPQLCGLQVQNSGRTDFKWAHFAPIAKN